MQGSRVSLHELTRAVGSTEAAVLALRLLADAIGSARNMRELKECVSATVRSLLLARPTSAMMINVSRDVLLGLLAMYRSRDLGEARAHLLGLIDEKIREAEAAVEATASIACKRLQEGDVVMTNGYSRTVHRTLVKALEEGKEIRVIVTEARPGSDGLRMAKLLGDAGLKVNLIVDSAARFFMKEATKVVVGAEAIAANGAVISKVGTSMLALAAHEARVRVFVVGGTYKLSVETVFGELVDIPMAEPSALVSDEVLKMIGEGLTVEAPILDVTPPEYIDAIVTERGLVAPQAVPLLVKEVYGSWPPKIPSLLELLDELEAI